MNGINPHKQQFTTEDVLAACPGLAGDRLTTWLSRGHLRLTQKPPGSGRARLYAASDVILIAATFEMVKLGVPIADASTWAMLVRRHAVDRILPVIGELGPLIVILFHHPEKGIVGKQAFIEKPNDDLGELLKSAPAFVWVNADNVIDRTLAELQKIADTREEDQSDDGGAGDRQYLDQARIALAEKIIEIVKLEERYQDAGGELTIEQQNELGGLRFEAQHLRESIELTRERLERRKQEIGDDD